jgi:dienelactone hydrolase
MKKVIIAISLMLFITNGLIAQISHQEAKEIADKFLTKLVENDPKAMYEHFNETVKGQLSLEQTSSLWSQITNMFGEFKSRGEIFSIDYNGSIVCSNVLSFRKGMLEAKVTVDKAGLVSGFFIVPKQSDEDYVLPEYADSSKFVELKLKFGEAPFILDAVLSLPKSKVKTPVVILVHGSGPHDMDETIGPNKPFKDIATGLASNGIAVFRYNKRTKQYAELMLENFMNSDIYDEVINDVTNAVNLINGNSSLYNIDSTKIYVLGHSLGGTLLPRIEQKNENLAGLISLAGMTRKISDVLLDQYNYLFSIDGSLDDEEKNQINNLKEQIKRMLSPDLNATMPPDSLPLGMPAKYWMTFREVDPASEIMKFNKRIFILQGERDYQVTTEDYDIWKKSLANNKNAKFKLYKNLNHLFQKGEGKSKPDEYYTPIKVDSEVIIDVSKWILE